MSVAHNLANPVDDTEFLVKPDVPTPDPTATVELSNIDLLLPNNWFPSYVYVFEKSSGDRLFMPPEQLKTALSKVLSQFRMFAGTISHVDSSIIRDTPSKPVHVTLNDRGCWFMVEKTDISFQSLKEKKFATGKLPHILLPWPHAERAVNPPLFACKAVYFPCGSVMLTTALCHLVADGMGRYQFMRSWGLAARGLPFDVLDQRHFFKPSIEPNMEDVSQVKEHWKKNSSDFFASTDPTLFQNSESYALCTSHATIANLKEEVNDYLRPKGAYASTNDILTAFSWRITTRFRKVPRNHTIYLARPIDIRSNYNPPLAQNSFGNGIIVEGTSMQVEDLLESHIGEVCLRLRESVRNIKAYKAIQKYIDTVELTVDKSQVMKYFSCGFGENLVSSSWLNFDHIQIDFGYGPCTAMRNHEGCEGSVILFSFSEHEYGICGGMLISQRDLLLNDPEVKKYFKVY